MIKLVTDGLYLARFKGDDPAHAFPVPAWDKARPVRARKAFSDPKDESYIIREVTEVDLTARRANGPGWYNYDSYFDFIRAMTFEEVGEYLQAKADARKQLEEATQAFQAQYKEMQAHPGMRPAAPIGFSKVECYVPNKHIVVMTNTEHGANDLETYDIFGQATAFAAVRELLRQQPQYGFDGADWVYSECGDKASWIHSDGSIVFVFKAI